MKPRVGSSSSVVLSDRCLLVFAASPPHWVKTALPHASYPNMAVSRFFCYCCLFVSLFVLRLGYKYCDIHLFSRLSLMLACWEDLQAEELGWASGHRQARNLDFCLQTSHETINMENNCAYQLGSNLFSRWVLMRSESWPPPGEDLRQVNQRKHAQTLDLQKADMGMCFLSCIILRSFAMQP